MVCSLAASASFMEQGQSVATETSPSVNYRNVRYRLLPGFARTARQLFSLAGICRLVWNRFLARNQEAYQLHQENPEHHATPSVHFFSLCKGFTELHNSGEFPLAEGVCLCCCQTSASGSEVGTSLGSPSLRGVGSRETTSGYLSLAL